MEQKKSILLENLEKFDFEELKSILSIGITASASAPEILVQNFIKLVKKNYKIKLYEQDYIKENVFFKIPQDLKSINF